MAATPRRPLFDLILRENRPAGVRASGQEGVRPVDVGRGAAKGVDPAAVAGAHARGGVVLNHRLVLDRERAARPDAAARRVNARRPVVLAAQIDPKKGFPITWFHATVSWFRSRSPKFSMAPPCALPAAKSV